jgi:hypothetical protein
MTLDTAREQELLLKIQELEQSIALKKGLPHLYSFKWYQWAREVYESTSKIDLLCAANQISKSSTQIRKAINWATDKPLWPKLWNHDPNQFWYLYPTSQQVNIEFETKWKLFLPKGEYKTNPIYGWDVEKKDGNIIAIHFNSGVHIYFKTYAQNASSLQSGTCDAILCDEELPEHLFHELIFRITASDGYFHMVFTATLGQDFWRRAMELDSLAEGEVEALPEAKKRCVSLYECQYYEDGSASHWTTEKINVARNRCATHSEVLKRIFGRFVIDKGKLKYAQFDYKRHMKIWHPIPKTWLVYGGVDIGSGKKENQTEQGHPAAIAFIAVSPDYKQGRVFLGWRGDDESTTAGDVVKKYIEIKKANNIQPVTQVYDWASADFFSIARGLGEHFEKAEKGHDIGEDILNVLFKNDMLFIYQTDELEKLAREFTSLRNPAGKRQKNDLSDAVRYIAAKIPWNWEAISDELRPDQNVEVLEKPMNSREAEIAERRKAFDENAFDNESLEQEFAEANENYGY